MSLPAAHRTQMKNLFRQIPAPPSPPQHTQTQKKGGKKAVLKRTDSSAPVAPMKPYKKKPIPTAIREAAWVLRCGRVFEHKCLTTWCPNMLTVFEFQAGHDIPESKGGATKPENLYPICSRCNQSMGNRYTFQEWCAIQPGEIPPPPPPLLQPPPPPRPTGFRRYFCCWSKKSTSFS